MNIDSNMKARPELRYTGVREDSGEDALRNVPLSGPWAVLIKKIKIKTKIKEKWKQKGA